MTGNVAICLLDMEEFVLYLSATDFHSYPLAIQQAVRLHFDFHKTVGIIFKKM